MAYVVKILADSVNPVGDRLTTFELTYPRFVHAEFMTHRMFSRNAASSRAIPIANMIARVQVDPAMPVWWGKNQSGMQAREELEGDALTDAYASWLKARDVAVERATEMLEIGVHKQIVNRLLEPWMWITVICTATDYLNFFHLRCHPDAQPEIQKLAYMMQDAYLAAFPREVAQGNWHLPLVRADEIKSGAYSIDDLCKISVGRCARVSYLTHEGVRDPLADIELHDKLLASGHWSPFEHVARPLSQTGTSGNFKGWSQYRKHFSGENQGGQVMPDETKPANDPITPNHYQRGGLQAIEVIEKWGLTFCLGNAVKYIQRYRDKNGLEDLKKARWYLDREILNMEK